MKYKPRNCAVCGNEFNPTNSTQKYCNECGPKKNKKKKGRTIYNKKCAMCGEKFTTVEKGAKYCNSKCRSKAQYHRLDYVCAICGAPMGGAGKRVYCSEACKRKALLVQSENSVLERFGDTPLKKLDYRYSWHTPFD